MYEFFQHLSIIVTNLKFHFNPDWIKILSEAEIRAEEKNALITQRRMIK